MIMRVVLTVHLYLILIFCYYPSGDASTQGTKCDDYFKKKYEPVNGDKYNYCWKFVPHKYSSSAANRKCQSYRGRMIAITSVTKAKKLSAFVKEIIQYYKTGKKGGNLKSEFKGGWPKGKVWVSGIKKGRWSAKNFKVTKDATKEASIKPGTHCAVFDYETSTWRYEKCSKKYYFICESVRPTYPDDVGAEDMTTPSYSLAPTLPPPKGAELACPLDFDVYGKHCYYIGQVRESQVQAQKRCEKKGGNLVWISDRKKNSQVKGYVMSHQGKFRRISESAWLGRLEGNGFIIKWKDIGTSARYLINANGMQNLNILKKGIMPKLTIGKQGFVSRCGEPCMKVGAFCEAPRKILTEEEKRYRAEKAGRDRKAKIARKAELAKKAEEARMLMLARRKNVVRRMTKRIRMAKEAKRKAELAGNVEEVRKMEKEIKYAENGKRSAELFIKKELAERKAESVGNAGDSKKTKKAKEQKHIQPKAKMHKKINNNTHNIKKSKLRPSKQVKTQRNNSRDKPRTQYSIRDSKTNQQIPVQTEHPIEIRRTTKEAEPESVTLETLEKIDQVKENTDAKDNGKTNSFLMASGSSVALFQHHMILFIFSVLSHVKNLLF